MGRIVLLVAVVVLAVLVAPAGDAARYVCRYERVLPEREQQLRDAIGGRQHRGLPAGRAFVARLLDDQAAQRRAEDVGSGFPVTAREADYFRGRDRITEQSEEVRKFLKPLENVSGGLSIQDDYPRPAYLQVDVTRPLTSAEKRSIDRRARHWRPRLVKRSEKTLRHLQATITKDGDALERDGVSLHLAYVDIDHNAVGLHYSSERPDAADVLRSRYGTAITSARVSATSQRCSDPDGYKLSPDGRTLTVAWYTSGSASNHRVEVREFDDKILIGGVDDLSYLVTGDRVSRQATVTLTRPLANRDVRSAVSRRIVRPGLD